MAAVEQINGLDLQSLVMYGDKSQSYYRRVVELLAELLPNVQMEVLAGAAHMSPLTNPEQIAAKLAVHLEAVKNSS